MKYTSRPSSSRGSSQCWAIDCEMRRVDSAVAIGDRAHVFLVNSSICEAKAAFDVALEPAGEVEQAAGGAGVGVGEEHGGPRPCVVSGSDGRVKGSMLKAINTYVEGVVWRSERRPCVWQHNQTSNRRSTNLATQENIAVDANP